MENNTLGSLKRVTLSDIAREADVSIGTVSLCLNNNKRAAKKTRERIQEIAERMGYREDPALSALVAYRTAKKMHLEYEILAFLSGWNPEDPSHSTLNYRSSGVEPAKARAERFGFELREFWIPSNVEEQMRVGRRLYQMGVRGVILAGTPKDQSTLNLPWHDFATLVLGRSNAPSTLDRCAANFNQGLELMVSKLRKAGCRRLGIAATDTKLSWTSYEEMGGLFRAWYMEGCGFHLVEPFIECGRVLELESVIDWIQKTRVDGIITHDPGLVLQAAEQLGLEVPGQLQVAGLDLPSSSPYAGIITPDAQVAEVAVDRLRYKLLHRDWGIPKMRIDTMIDCQWSPGITVREVSRL